MARPRDEREVTVSADEGRYVSTTEGPATDTTVHTRTTPGILPAVDPAVFDRSQRKPVAPHLPNLRKSARAAEDVERDRPRRAPSWNPIVLGVVVFVAILVLGGTAVFVAVGRQSEAPVAPPAPPPAEIGGVPVRQGMKGGVD